MKKFLFIVLALLGAIGPADAQQPQALIVATCGTPPVSYVAGTYGILTMDTTGKLCDSATGGGGTQAVNLTQILGAAVSATNPLYVAPATSVNPWPISAASLPLPTGAATSANQPALGQQLAAASEPVVLTAIQVAALTPPTVAVSVPPVTATNPAVVVDLRPDSPGIITLGQTTKSASVPVTLASDQGAIGALSSQYPGTATAVEVSATGTTAATAATMPAVSGKTNYVCGFTITADASALATGTAALSGLTNSLSYLQTIVAVASGTSDLTKTFNPCLPASATNTAIVITSAAAGVGGNTIVNIQGYVQ